MAEAAFQETEVRQAPVSARETRLSAGVVGMLALAGLVLEYQAYVGRLSGARLFWRTVDFFSFFTVDANLFVAVVALSAAFAGVSERNRLTRPIVTGAVVLYAAIAGATYFVVLRPLHHPVGLEQIADDLLHYTVPPAFFALWLVALPKAGLAARQALAWLVFPLGYLGYVLARGPKTGFSPYPFLDPAALGYGRVALNVAAFAVASIAAGALLVALDRALGSRWQRRQAVAIDAVAD